MGSAQGKQNEDVMPCAYKGAAERVWEARGGNIADMYAGGCDTCGGVSDDGSYLGGNFTVAGGNFTVAGGARKGKFIGSADVNLDSVKDYSGSVNSAAKASIVKELIEVGRGLGLLKSTTSTDNAELLRVMAASIPSIASNPQVHAEACKRIAAAINSAYGNKLIDPTLPPAVICQQVVEILLSLTRGMHSEFLMVYEDAKRIITNLRVLKQALEADRASILERVSSSDDALLASSLGSHTDLFRILLEEVDRQIQLLENLLSIEIKPADRDLAQLLKHSDGFEGLVGKIDTRVGSDKFGQVIRTVLSGLGVTANFALVIDNALKTVGLKMEEYAAMETVKDLRDKLTTKAALEGLDDDKLHKYLESAELLYKNLYRSQDIAAARKTTGASDHTNMNRHNNNFDGADDNIADLYGGGNDFIVAGDDDKAGGNFTVAGGNFTVAGGDEYAKSKLDKRVEDRQKLKKLVFNAFYRQINELFNSFIGTLDIMTMKVGTEISLSEQLDGLRRSLGQVNDRLIRNQQIYHALIGYYNDAMSKSKKDQLLNELKSVLSSVDTILEMPQYASSKNYFANIKNSIEAILNLIAKYSAEITLKFGGDTFTVAGGSDGFVLAAGGDLYEPAARMYVPAKNINDAIRQFDYKYREAKIRQNLDVTKAELGKYAEKYEDLVAQSIADILRADKIVYDKLFERINDKLLAVGPDANGVTDATHIADAKAFLQDQWEVKQKFWATVEAVDTYMRVFTDGIVSDPNAIRDIRSMLSDVEVINDWYNDATGNGIAAVFEHFPNNITNAGGRTMPTDALHAMENKSHPYKKLADANPGGTVVYPGNPYLVAMPGQGRKASDRAKSALGGLAVLKNLLSVFSHIGSNFAGKNLSSQVFMKPTQMYNNLMEYMRCSAFAQGFGLGGCEVGADGDFTDLFYDGNNVTLAFNPVTGVAAYNVDPAATYEANGNVNIGVDNSGVGMRRERDYAVEEHILNNINANLVGNPIPVASNHANAGAQHQHRILTIARLDQAAKDRLFRKRWGVWMRSVMPEINKQEGFSFKREDEYFVLVLKSIAAKILTVVGMYDVFDRPMEHNGLSPIRMIIGGAADTPKVEEGAAALYLRLPLLAQFYRGIFGYDENTAGANLNNNYDNYDQMRLRGNDNLKISMIPDVDGVFSGLIRFVFRKSKNIETGSYSDEDVKEIVREINLIYQKMSAKYPQDTATKTFNDFVAEMNRRYAIVTTEERKKYEEEFDQYLRLDYDKFTGQDAYNREVDMPETGYAILPGEGDEEIERKSAAQRLLGDGFTNDAKSKKNPYTITIQHKKLVNKFRCAIDKYFENATEEYSFDGAIRAAKQKLKHEANDEARLRIVSGLIRGVDMYNAVDSMKFVLFEETVIGGLNMLSVFHSMLTRFKHICQIVDLKEIERMLWKYLEDTVGNAPNINNFRAALVAHATGNLKVDAANAPYATIINSIGAFSINALAQLTAGGVLNGGNVTTVAAIKKFVRDYATPSDANPATLFMQEFLDNQQIMRLIIETVGAVSNDFQALLGVRVEEGRIIANTNGLKSLIEEMFGHVGYFIDLLRAHIPEAIMDKYTNKLTAGSYYWLQEQILEKILIGRPQQAPEFLRYQSLDEVIQRLSYTYGVVSVCVAANARRQYGSLFAELVFYDASDIGGNSGVDGNVGVLPLIIDPTANSIDNVRFSGLVGKRMLDTRFAARQAGIYSNGPDFTENKSLLFSFNQLVAKYLQSFYDPITGKIYLGIINQFAMGVFGQAIANYEYTYPDTIPMVAMAGAGANAGAVSAVMKADDYGINQPTLAAVANAGLLSPGINLVIAASDTSGLGSPLQASVTRAVDNQNNIAASLVFGSRADPDGAHVLFTSLAMLIKNILTNKLESVGLAHIHENIADVPIHIKEKMRANLPAFKNLFRGLIARAEHIKKFMAHADLTRVMGGSGTHNPWPAKLVAAATADAVAKDRFTGIIDSIISGCNAIVTCCDNSLREVGDDAKYFELYNGSIRDYRAQYNIDPFMPLSSTLSVFRNLDVNTYMDMFPTHSLGSDNFKMMYGTRALIGGMNTAVLPEHVPGFTNIVDKYNLMSDNKSLADKARADGFLKTYVKMLRFAFEARHVKGLLSATGTAAHNDGAFTKRDLVLPVMAGARPAANLNNTSEVSIVAGEVAKCGADPWYATAAYAFDHSVSDIVRLTESSLQDEKIKEFVEHICAGDKTKHSLELQNIVDLNIVPINVHALAREIPLINLYNYAYTFDRLIVELYYGLGAAQTSNMISSLCNGELPISSSKAMLAALLVNPYLDLYSGRGSGPLASGTDDVNLYDKYAKGMLLGQVDNSELGRPKFLSDQIYNKVVFGSVYDDGDMEEIGPIADEIRAGSITAEVAKRFATDLVLDVVEASALAVDNTLTRAVLTAPIQQFIIYMMERGYGVVNHNTVIAGITANATLGLVLGAVALLYRPIAVFINAANKGTDVAANMATLRRNLNNVINAINVDPVLGLNPHYTTRTIGEITPIVISRIATMGRRQYQTNYAASRKLQWIAGDKIESADVTGDLYDILRRVGRLRFDTVFVRNLIFVTNLYRSVRMKLARDLTYNKDVIAKSIPITNNNITEFYGNGSDRDRAQYDTKKYRRFGR